MFDLSNKGNRDAMQALAHILYKIEGFRPKSAKPLTPVEDDIVISRINGNSALPLIQIATKKELEAEAASEQGDIVISPYFRKGAQ